MHCLQVYLKSKFKFFISKKIFLKISVQCQSQPLQSPINEKIEAISKTLGEISSWNATKVVREFIYDFSNLQKKINKQIDDSLAAVKKQLNKDIASLNASNYEQSTKLLGIGLQSLSKSLTGVVNHVFDVASTVDETIAVLSTIDTTKGESLTQIKSSVDKVLNSVSNIVKKSNN